MRRFSILLHRLPKAAHRKLYEYRLSTLPTESFPPSANYCQGSHLALQASAERRLNVYRRSAVRSLTYMGEFRRSELVSSCSLLLPHSCEQYQRVRCRAPLIRIQQAPVGFCNGALGAGNAPSKVTKSFMWWTTLRSARTNPACWQTSAMASFVGSSLVFREEEKGLPPVHLSPSFDIEALRRRCG